MKNSENSLKEIRHDVAELLQRIDELLKEPELPDGSIEKLVV